jgi:hypothetical protein
VLVFGCVHVGAQLVGCGPEGFLDVFEHCPPNNADSSSTLAD